MAQVDSGNIEGGKDRATEVGSNGPYGPPVPMQNYPPWPQYPPYQPNEWDPYYPPYPQQERNLQDPATVKQECPPPPHELYQPPSQAPPPQDLYQPPPEDLYQAPPPYDYPPYPYFDPYQPTGLYPPGPYGYPAWGEPTSNFIGDWEQPGQNADHVTKDEPVIKPETDKDITSTETDRYKNTSDKFMENILCNDKVPLLDKVKNEEIAVASDNFDFGKTMEVDKSVTNSDLRSPVNNVLSKDTSHSTTEEQNEIKPDIDDENKSEYSEWLFDDPLLPVGWISRKYQVMAYGKLYTEFQFMSPEQTLFRSLSLLIDYMKSVGTFTKEFMEKLIVSKSGSVEIKQMLMTSLSGKQNETLEQKSSAHSSSYTDWYTDESLPVGWKKRSTDFRRSRHSSEKLTKYQYLSTTNQIFESRTGVVDYMKNSGMYSVDEIAKVLSGSKRGNPKSNWENDETLPEGWKKKSHFSKSSGQIQGYSYLCPNTQKVFKSRKEVISFMQNSDIYPMDIIQDAIERGKFVKEDSRKMGNVGLPIWEDDKKYNWKDDETLPEGWKKSSYFAKSTGKLQQNSYLCPKKEKMFTSRREVIKYIQNCNLYSEEEMRNAIENGKTRQPDSKILQSGKPESSQQNGWERFNWEDDESLPTGWKKRSYDVMIKNRKCIKYQYLSTTKEKFDARSRVIEHMEKTGMFSNEEIEKVRAGKKSAKGSNKIDYTDWEDDNSLPIGWKKRSYEILIKNKKRKRYQYLSTSNEKFEARSHVIDHMKKSGEFSNEEIERVESGGKRLPIPGKKIDDNDWKEDETLPTGWKKRSYEVTWKTGTHLKHQYLAPTNETFSTRAGVIDFMKKCGTFSVEEMEKVKSGKRSSRKIFTSDTIKQNVISKNDLKAYHWETDESLPVGWKKRSYEHKDSHVKSGKVTKYVYLSSTNQIFHARSTVIAYMTKSGMYTIEEIEKVKSGSKRGNAVKFSSKMEEDEDSSNFQAKPNVMGKPETPKKELVKTVEEEISANGEALSENIYDSSLSESSNYEWKIDESLPKGWKKRYVNYKWKNSKGEVKNGKQYRYLAPSQKVFNSRATVVAHMRQTQDYSEEEILTVKQGKAKSLHFFDNKEIMQSKKRRIKKESKDNDVIENEMVLCDSGKEEYPNNNLPKSVCSSWEFDNEMLPEGWRKRFYFNDKDIKVFQYIGVTERVFQSTKEVFDFIKFSRTYTLDDALKFLSGVKKQEMFDDKTTDSKEDLHYEYECDYCPQLFYTPNEKVNHQQSEHSGQVRYKCNDCGFGNLRKASLFYHIQSKHSDAARDDQVTFDIEVPIKAKQPNQVRIKEPPSKRRKLKQNMKKTSASVEKEVNENALKNDYVIEQKSNEQGMESKETYEIDTSSFNTIDNKKNYGNSVDEAMNNEDSSEDSSEIKMVSDEDTKKFEEDTGLEDFPSNEGEDKSGADLITEKESIEKYDSDMRMDLHNDEQEKEQDYKKANTEINLHNGDQEEDNGNNDPSIDSEKSENNEDSFKKFIVPLGPEINISRGNYEMLSTIFIQSPNPSDDVIQDIAEDVEMSWKDIKWVFIKLRFKFQQNKEYEYEYNKEYEYEVDDEAVKKAVNLIKENYQDEEYFIF